MKAVVFHGVGDIRLDNVSDPVIQEPTDVIVRLTASAICGTDLHFVRGTVPGMVPGTSLGHEGVRIVEEIGKDACNSQPGHRHDRLAAGDGPTQPRSPPPPRPCSPLPIMVRWSLDSREIQARSGA